MSGGVVAEVPEISDVGVALEAPDSSDETADRRCLFRPMVTLVFRGVVSTIRRDKRTAAGPLFSVRNDDDDSDLEARGVGNFVAVATLGL